VGSTRDAAASRRRATAVVRLVLIEAWHYQHRPLSAAHYTDGELGSPRV